jgi:hypothetical protein
MPLFHEMPGDLLDVVAVHDLQYFIADTLPFTAPARSRHH